MSDDLTPEEARVLARVIESEVHYYGTPDGDRHLSPAEEDVFTRAFEKLCARGGWSPEPPEEQR